MEVLGIDIGGSGIKGAIVNISQGDFVTDRLRIETPQPAKPEAVAEVVAKISKHFGWRKAIGCTFPAVVQHGVTLTAANVDKRWIGTDAKALLEGHTGNPVIVLNDADAAGIAEMKFGAGRDRRGLVVILTLGTGVGSSLFMDGRLVPNTEFGHLIIRGKDAELRTSDRGRQEKGYSWKAWGKRLSEHLRYMEALMTPDLFIIGGGVSKKFEKFFSHIHCDTEIVPAQLRNRAGIVGAAIAAIDLN
ncbi:MAG: ROK family protein [Chloroflexi bacterium]|nr:ROK family protein [Chloroflexota bacterium]